MKTLLGLFLTFIMSWSLNGQNSRLTVNIGDLCDKTISEKVTTKLYWNNGLNRVFITESNKNPVIFENLVSGLNYSIDVSIADREEYNFTIKDAVLIQRHILGLEQLVFSALWAADCNLDSDVTSEDITELIKGIHNLSNQIPKKYFELPNDIQMYVEEMDTIHLVIDNLQNDQIIQVKLGTVGNVAQANQQYCDGQCPDITDKRPKLLFDNIDVSKGKEITVPIYFNAENRYLGMEFTLMAKNATIVDVITEIGAHYSLDPQGSIKSTFLNQKINDIGSDSVVVYHLTLKPEIDGKLADILSLKKENSINEVIIEKDGCIVSLKNLDLNPNQIIRENCIISWPENIVIANCDDLTGEPQVDPLCKNYYFIEYNDILIENCFKIVRVWTGVNWFTQKVETHYQVIRVRENFKHQCTKNHSINLRNGYEFLTARSLIVNPDSTHVYSFSKDDKGDSIRVLKYEAPYKVQYKVYDLTDSVFCIASIEKTNFDPTLLNVIQNIVVTYNNGYNLQAIQFIPNSILPSGVSDIGISYNGSEYVHKLHFDEQLSGKHVSLSFRYKANGQYQYFGEVTAYLKPFNIIDVPPLIFFTYNDYLTAGQPYKMEFYASNFTNILSFQFGMKLTNISLSTVENGVLQLNNSYAYFPNLDEIRVAWYDQAGTGRDFDKNNVLFSMTLIPEKSGFLKDFISIAPSIISMEATYSDLNVSGIIILDFNFLNRNLSNIVETDTKNIAIHPNPIYKDQLTILWKPDTQPLYITISDIMGKNLLRKDVSDNDKTEISIPIEHLTAGTYILSVHTQYNIWSKKLLVVR